MFTAIALIAVLVFLASSFWFVTSLVRLIPSKSRASAKKQLLISVIVAVIAIPVSVAASFNQFRDYGLESAEGLPEAMAAQREAAAAAKAEKDAAARVEQQRQAALDAQAEIDREARETADRAERRCNDNIAAFVMSQGFVKDRLRAPATAQFPNINEARVGKTGDCTFRVQSYVDAQNGFGALIRTRYQAEMEYFPGSDTWLGFDIIMSE